MTEYKAHGKRKLRYDRIIIPIIIVLLLILLISNARHSNDVFITVIKDTECDFCSNVDPLIEQIKQEDINIIGIKEIDYKQENAQKLLEKINAKTVPTIVIRGDAFTKTSFFKNLSSDDIEKKADKFVLSSFVPPLTNIETGEILGMVSVIHIKDRECTKCSDLNHAINRFKELGININNIKEIDKADKEAQELIKKYNIKKIPILIFDQQLHYYQLIRKNWEFYGSIEQDKTMIMRNTLIPYINLDSGEIKGLIDVIYIIDKTCDECYNPEIHKQEIARIMPQFDKEITLDINDEKAKELMNKYEINLVPTAIFSDDINEYPLFESFFSQDYIKQQDGNFVFKGHENLDIIYKDLKKDEIIS